MAWKAVITSWDLDGPNINIGYYDDTDPINPDGGPVFLYSQVFRRADVASAADLRAKVIEVGQRARAVHQRLQAIKATGVITIP